MFQHIPLYLLVRSIVDAARVPVLFEDSCRLCDKRASSLFPGGPPERKNCSLLQDDRDLHRLQPYLALTFKKSLESGGSRSSAIRAIGNSITTTSVPGIQAVSDYTNTLGQMSAASNLCRFFSGTKLERAQQLGSDGDVRAKVHTFMEQLVRLGAARRVATQERDYVVAVWVDCPGYVLPSNYKAMGLPALLDNAVWQLENNFRASPIVTAPTGIFGGCLESSGLWRPSRYIQRLSVKSTGTVYGVLSTQSVIAPSGKGFQLDRWIVGTTALSRVAQPYQQMFGSRSTATALEAMASIAINWTSDSSQGQALKWAMNFNRQSVDAVTEGPEDVFRMSLIGCMDSGKVGVEWLGENIDHHSVLYRMVTDMLGLDYDLCQSEGLVLMVSPQASCIGLLRAAVIESAQNNVTVLMSAVASGCLAFEAEQVQVRPALPVPAYRVCGVWVPTKHCRF